MGETHIFGCHGKMLRIDLTNQTHQTERISTDDLRLFLGGRGLGAAMLLRELPTGVDPLSQDNVLIFSTGPLVGSSVPSSDRYVLHTKSPLTGLYLFSISGGKFGRHLKKTGFDVVIIKGKSSRPVYLLIGDEGKVEFKSADHLWGQDTEKTQTAIQSEVGLNVGITCIGPAGEKEVPYACIINERRALGRGGAGAVMGSKNLKALAVRGEKRAPLFDSSLLKSAVKKAVQELKENPVTEAMKAYGSANMLKTLLDNGVLPERNWEATALGEAESISGERLRNQFLVKDLGCSNGCTVKCSKIFSVKEGQWAGTMSEGPEYETLYAFGSCCGVYDLPAIIRADSMCDLLGLDTISTGVSIGFAMECLEKGIISAEEHGAGDLAFGNAKSMIGLVEDIAFERHFGAVVAQGTKRMAARFGKGSEKFAMHTKGMELGGYDPRGLKGMSLVFACGPRGGCHHAGGFTVVPEIMNPNIDRFVEKGRAQLVADTRNRRASLCDSGLICAFVSIGLSNETVLRLLKGSTGLDYQLNDLFTIGDRISQLERAFNCREGLTREDDVVPERLLEEAISRGPSQGNKINDIESMKNEFYTICGWDLKTGIPLAERLEALEIGWVADCISAGKRMS
jgi:aldehyde:ferredoxin oxidoreductase